MSLELQGALWLKFDKKCPLVFYERTPRYGHGQPDIMGVNDRRFIFEIEIKRTVSDFRANAKKPHIVNRCSTEADVARHYQEMAPRQFWYLVPPKLVERVRPEVPDWAGLLTVENDPGDDGYSTPIRVKSIKPAPTNALSKKLSPKECIRLFGTLGNQIMSLMAANSALRSSKPVDCYFMDDYHSQKLEWNGERHVWVRNYDYLNFQI